MYVYVYSYRANENISTSRFADANSKLIKHNKFGR